MYKLATPSSLQLPLCSCHSPSPVFLVHLHTSNFPICQAANSPNLLFVRVLNCQETFTACHCSPYYAPLSTCWTALPLNPPLDNFSSPSSPAWFWHLPISDIIYFASLASELSFWVQSWTFTVTLSTSGKSVIKCWRRRDKCNKKSRLELIRVVFKARE